MFIEDPNDLDDVERLIKFNEIAQEYGRSIAAWETAPWIPEFELLRRDGIALPSPYELDDDELTKALWSIIESMAGRNTFFHHTDHLCDREFYERLYYDRLHQPTKDYAAVLDKEEITALGAVVHSIDMCDGDEDSSEYWRFYADEADREEEAGLSPGFAMPPRQPCPYDRDQFLPRSIDERMMERGEIEPFELTELCDDGTLDDEDGENIPW
jgi:hypothetical protein